MNSNQSSYQACRVCGQSSVAEYNILEQKVIDGVIIGQNRYYCSQKCRNLDNRGGLTGLIVILGAAIVVFSGIGLFDEFMGFVFFIGLLTTMVVLAFMRAKEKGNRTHSPHIRAVSTHNNEQSENLEENEEFLNEYLTDEEIEESRRLDNEVAEQRTNNSKVSDVPRRMNPNIENQVYSDILQKYVDICCHQTARLSDKYCMCGKALEYPSQIEK